VDLELGFVSAVVRSTVTWRWVASTFDPPSEWDVEGADRPKGGGRSSRK